MASRRRSTNFTGQVHRDQHSIPFWPEAGDLIIRKIIDHNSLDEDHMSHCIMSTFGPVELYKDNYYCYPDRCPDPARRAAYHRIFFRNGDHIIRRARFKRENNWALTEEDCTRVWVYWPGYQLHNTFVRLVSWGNNDYSVLTLERPNLNFGQFRFRAQTLMFHDDFIRWEPGDLIVRHFKPGPPGAPNPGWYRLIGVQEVDEESDMSYVRDEDILIKLKGRWELPSFPTDPVRMNTRIETYAYVYSAWNNAWTYLCGDTMLYDFNDWDTVMRLPRVDAVPQPVDIMISLNEELDRFGDELGGYVKFYQNPSTSTDPTIPRTTVFNPTRVPADGSTTSSAAPPNLPANAEAAWVEPDWSHLPVPVPDAAHPLVLRFGRWVEDTSPQSNAPYKWIWHPYIELYQRHPRSNDGQTYFTTDRTGINYGEGRGHPAWEEFTDTDLDMNTMWDMNNFPILQGDVVIRRDLKHPLHPSLTHTLYPATNATGAVRCCPGDLLVRYGLLNDPNYREEAGAGNHHHFGVELWLLMLDNDMYAQWAFRGRDQVVFGFPPNPKANPKKRQGDDLPCRLQGMYDGQYYSYNAPCSGRFRHALVALGGGGIMVGAPAAPSRQIRMRPRRLSSEEQENKENRPPRKLNKITIIQPTRPKLQSELLIPKFLNHETGNYSRIQELD